MLELTTTKERINTLHHYVQVELETLGKWTNSKGKRPRRRFWKDADDPKIWIISDSEYSEKELQEYFETLEEIEVVFHPFVIIRGRLDGPSNPVWIPHAHDSDIQIDFIKREGIVVCTLNSSDLNVISHSNLGSHIFLIQCKFPDIKFKWSDPV